MIGQFEIYLTSENIYLWTNIGVLPFWLLLIFVPNSSITKIFTNSIILPLILASAYTYTIYQTILLQESFTNIFGLYMDLDNLYTIFATESFLLLFWLHFVTLNLFLGSWIARDGIKHNTPRGLIAIILILIYFTGPVGLVLYWIFRIFYSRKIQFHD